MWYFIFAVILVAVLFEPARRALKKRKTEDIITQPFAVKFPCKINGVVNPPPQVVRVAARDRQLKDGNKLGGGVDGGIYLAGAFTADVSKTGNMTGEFILHGHRSKMSGTAQSDGTFTGHHGGGSFKGVITANGVTGTVHEGGRREWVYGDMVGGVV